jgi:hypothetical protein
VVGSASPASADNSGLYTIAAYWQGTAYPTWVGYGGNSGFSFTNIVPDYNDYNVTWIFNVPAGTPPGTYILDSSFSGGSSGAVSYVPLQVVNAPSRGQISGQMLTIDAGATMMQQEVNGNLVIYDASTGTAVSTNVISLFNSTTYNVGYVPPGSYRVCFVPMNPSMAPQWYPNAASFAQAASVTVAASQTVSNINFYLAPVRVPPSGFNLPAPASHIPGLAGCDMDFDLGTTVADVTYYLEYKDFLDASQWSVAQTLTGDGGGRTLADKSASSSHRFYRLRMVAP